MMALTMHGNSLELILNFGPLRRDARSGVERRNDAIAARPLAANCHCGLRWVRLKTLDRSNVRWPISHPSLIEVARPRVLCKIFQ